MVHWNEQRVINASIDKVWALFSDERLQIIMPQLKKHQLIEGPPNQVGSKYAQQNQMGNRLISYVMEITAYEDLPNDKRKDLSFVAGGLFRISMSFTLTRISDEQTLFVYSGSNTGINLAGRALLKLDPNDSSRKQAKELMDRVLIEAES